MAGYTQADFNAAYRGFYRDEQGWTMYKFRAPALESLVDYDPINGVTCVAHYNTATQWPKLVHTAQRIGAYFESAGTPLTATSSIVIIGGAFNWTGEILEDNIPGLESVTVDTSDYVQQVKGVSQDDDLIAAIQAQGYDHTLPNSVGEWLFNTFSDPRPRTRNPERCVQNSLLTVQERNSLRRLFQRNDITHILTEEVWQILTQEDKDRYTAAAASYGAALAHVIDSAVSS